MSTVDKADSCCPVCLESEVEAKWIDSAGIRFECPRCGEFVVTRADSINLKSPRLRAEWDAQHLSALIREHNTQPLPRLWLRYGMAPYGDLKTSEALVPIELEELLTRWPKTVPERIDRTLCNFARLSRSGGEPVQIPTGSFSIAFAHFASEGQYHIRALLDYGFLTSTSSSSGVAYIVTPDGWKRFDELTRGKSSRENPAFVAMWFGGENDAEQMEAVYTQGIYPAVQQAGYKADRVDLTEHIDWIMDKMLGMIRLAPFVVADFTENRNGVYFEAGFARGLGTPVIHTCRKDHLKDAHFDTKQLNHVLWTTPEELREKLYHRIMGTIGEGPFWQGRARSDEHNTSSMADR